MVVRLRQYSRSVRPRCVCLQGTPIATATIAIIVYSINVTGTVSTVASISYRKLQLYQSAHREIKAKERSGMWLSRVGLGRMNMYFFFVGVYKHCWLKEMTKDDTHHAAYL